MPNRSIAAISGRMPKTKPPRPDLPKNHQAVIDELGDLAQYKKQFDRYEELRAAVLAWFAEFPPEMNSTVEGAAYAVTVSERRNERHIRSMAALFRAVGERVFLKHCKFALQDVDKLLPNGRRAALLVESQTGPRSLAVARRAK